MRKLIAHLAMSADGFIARSDGGVDWLEGFQAGDYGMKEFLASIDTVVWGRATYDMALGFGMPPSTLGEHIQHYVFTHRPAEPDAQVTFVNEPVKDFARRSRKESGKDVWLMGGAALWGAFLDADEVDELAIALMPVLIGEGIPLLPPRRRTVAMTLLDTRRFDDGVVMLRYRVTR